MYRDDVEIELDGTWEGGGGIPEVYIIVICKVEGCILVSVSLTREVIIKYIKYMFAC